MHHKGALRLMPRNLKQLKAISHNPYTAINIGKSTLKKSLLVASCESEFICTLDKDIPFLRNQFWLNRLYSKYVGKLSIKKKIPRKCEHFF